MAFSFISMSTLRVKIMHLSAHALPLIYTSFVVASLSALVLYDYGHWGS